MVRVFRRFLILAASTVLLAQNWQTMENLPSVDFTGLAPAKKAAVLKLLREHDCPCGCGMKLAECRVKDPSCSYSKGFSASTIQAVKGGKTITEAVKVAVASRWGHVPEPKLLDDPVKIATAGAPMIGPPDARVTLVEFSDFQCPFCIKAVDEIKAVMQAFPKDVKLIFKQYPLDSHSQAASAAAAAIAAHRQGKFWPMHDALFAAHAKLSRQAIIAAAEKVGLDMKRFTADWDSAAVKQAIARDQADGEKAGVEATPTLFIDGQRYNGPRGLDAIRPIIQAELKK